MDRYCAHHRTGLAALSKLETRHHLHLARMEAVRQTGHLSKAAKAKLEGCPVEACPIQGVKCLHADLQLLCFANLEFFPQRQIDVFDSLVVQVFEVAWGTAQLLVAGISETVRVEHRDAGGRAVQERRRRVMRADSSARARASHV